MSSVDRYNLENIKRNIDDAITDKSMPDKLYSSVNAITNIIEAIVMTGGKDWVTRVLNKDGNPMLTNEEQIKFTEAFEPYINTIINYFKNNKHENQEGGQVPDIIDIPLNTQKSTINTQTIKSTNTSKDNISALSGLPNSFINNKLGQSNTNNSKKQVGPDVLYEKMIDKIKNVNSTVNNYASKYGILKLEKEHDIGKDVRLVPKPVASLIASGLKFLPTLVAGPAAGIDPEITLQVLDKVKVPLRTLITAIYVALDVARIGIAVSGTPERRKIFTILLSLVELLRGDWKKALLSFIGYYGTSPLLIGEMLKVFLSVFQTTSPYFQDKVIFGIPILAKSLIIGLLLSIFQITAPEEIRLPLIGVLEKIAHMAKSVDKKLIEADFSARPAYFTPTFEDLNNIQAVFNDPAYVCSCEVQELIDEASKSSIISVILQLLNVPVTNKFREVQCGSSQCKTFVKLIANEAVDRRDFEKRVGKYQEPIGNAVTQTAPTTLNDPAELSESDIQNKLAEPNASDVANNSTSPAVSNTQTEPTEPTEPTESTEPTEPTESTEPTETAVSDIPIKSAEPNKQNELDVPMEPMEPTELTKTANPIIKEISPSPIVNPLLTRKRGGKLLSYKKRRSQP
jgi:hypothetical protein